MRILQVGSSMPDDWGGIERYVTYLSGALGERGHEVVVVAPAGSPLAQHNQGRVVSGSVRWKQDPAALAFYLRLLRNQSFDAVSVHFSPDYLVPAWAARLRRQRGLVLTRHVALPFPAKRARQYSRLYDRFIGVSGAVVEALRTSGLAEKSLSRVETGVPPLVPTLSRDEARTALGITDEFAVGSFSRLVPEKGIDVLLRACRDTDLSVHVFGEGPDKDKLRQQGGRNAFFHGQVADVADVMVAMDAIVVPSVWPEALGLTTLESMSLGIPLVASEVGGIPEAVNNGTTGLLVSPGDSDALKAALMRLKGDRGLCQSLGSAAKAYFLSERTPAQMAEATEKVYRAAAGLV
ncbi:MAG: glycosyltransferase family 4 protein [Armatimonadetes bacterium]|nr:glycosyltransferase family 4 protein [Armatimonadota bacterium]